MPRKVKSSTSAAPLAPIPSEILDQCVRQGPLTSEELDAVVRRFKTAIIERALGGELTQHVGYALFFDALRVTIRDEAVVRSKAVYLALAVLPDGTRDILGI